MKRKRFFGTFCVVLALWQCAPRNDTFNFPVLPPHESEEHTHNPSAGHSSAPPDAQSTGTFGAPFEPQNTQPVSILPELLANADSVVGCFEGPIVEVCQKKGCWMTLGLGHNKVARVTFKDYGFFVPKTAGGRHAIVKGVARKEIITVEMLRHYAQDRGASKEEVEAIKEPETEWSIVAEGVIIR
ncbi:MAG: DUF4920 domain-containing protein [Flavobacteriales bacterium]|nr:DUF4920 domain-containing protein [Flavobacteriales bacterium]